jgi:hypothetical protein
MKSGGNREDHNNPSGFGIMDEKLRAEVGREYQPWDQRRVVHSCEWQQKRQLTEYSRLVADHGLLGFISFIAAYGLPGLAAGALLAGVSPALLLWAYLEMARSHADCRHLFVFGWPGRYMNSRAADKPWHVMHH